MYSSEEEKSPSNSSRTPMSALWWQKSVNVFQHLQFPSGDDGGAVSKNPAKPTKKSTSASFKLKTCFSAYYVSK